MNKNSLSYKRYLEKKGDSYRRGIEWKLTYEEWYNWWLSNGVDKEFDFTPMNKNKLCMCRYNDTGPYELTNIYCATNSENVKLRNKLYHSSKENSFVTPYGVFYSARAASKELNVHYNTIRNRMQKYPNEYFYK
jgi:hypothetical protein